MQYEDKADQLFSTDGKDFKLNKDRDGLHCFKTQFYLYS